MNLLKSFLDLYVRKYVGIGDFVVRFMSGKLEVNERNIYEQKRIYTNIFNSVR